MHQARASPPPAPASTLPATADACHPLAWCPLRGKRTPILLPASWSRISAPSPMSGRRSRPDGYARPRRLPLHSRCHMWTALCLQDDVVGFRDRIVCVHVRPSRALAHERWPRWVPRREAQTTMRPRSATGICGFAHVLDRSNATCSSSCKVRHQPGTDAGLPCSVPGPILQGACCACGCWFHGVSFARDHQLPGDAGELVGQRHCHELWRLALESFPTQAANLSPSRLRPSRTRLIRAVAPTTSTLRRPSSPARVITPGLALPAVG